MSARLESSVRSLHLIIDRPIERYVNGEPEYRNDLSAVMVWCSTTSGFTPSASTLVFNGLSMSITITALTDGTVLSDNTNYYVKYALISEVDDSFILYSAELTAKTSEVLAGISYLADLDNDGTVIPADATGENAVYDNAFTTMRVYYNGVEQGSGWTYYVSNLSNVQYRDNNDLANRTGIGPQNGLIDYFPLKIVSLTQDYGSVEITAINENNITLKKLFWVSKLKGAINEGVITYPYLDVITPTIYKNSNTYTDPGDFTPLKFLGKKIVGSSLPEAVGIYYYTITGINAGDIEDQESSEASILPQSGIEFQPLSNSTKTGYVVRLYSTNKTQTSIGGGFVLLDTENINVSLKGDDGEAYIVTIESTNGDTFRPGSSFSTTLVAHVFKNGVEITDLIPASRFKWRRVSYYPQSYPNDDYTWDSQHASNYKSIIITADDVTQRATFHCDIQSE